MKKLFLWLSILILVILGYLLGHSDNAPKRVDVSEIPSRLD